MKQTSILFILFLIVACNSLPSPSRHVRRIDYLTEKDAISEVESLLGKLNVADTKSFYSERRVSTVWTKHIQSRGHRNDLLSETVLYFINFEDSLGFAVVSSDPAKGILGLALSGSIGENDSIRIPGLAMTLANLEAYARESPSRFRDSIAYYEYGEWSPLSYYSPYMGFCPVKWDQGSTSGNQYNSYCDSSGHICPAGCVAVATAQLMAMYKQPSSYNGYTFDWNAMIVNSSAQNNVGEYYVARLMQQLGLYVNLDMQYGVNLSSAPIAYIPRTLENFGFSQGGIHTYFSVPAMQELQNGYPIIIGGFVSYSSDIGHAWLGHGLIKKEREICGYSAEGELLLDEIEKKYYVLCNFGWEGVGDGYYDSNAFYTTNGPIYNDPDLLGSSSGSYDFPYVPYCVIGIRP